MIQLARAKSSWVIRAVATALALTAGSVSGALPLKLIELPPGFQIGIYAERVPGARSMALGERGTLFIGTFGEGKVYAVPPHASGDRVKPITLVKKLQNPNGVAFRDGALYVAERGRILRFDDIEDRLATPPAPLVVFDQLPRDAQHASRTIHFGPDGLLYVGIGAPCNVCMPQAQYAQIARIDLDSWPAQKEVFAQGVRNSVGFDWDPRNQELWFTDNAVDLPAADAAPDELNHAPESGKHFGFPFCHSGQLPDSQFGAQRDCSEFVPPALQLGPRATPLGMRFYTGEQFPAEYRNAIFIAERGSFDSEPGSGFRVSVVKRDDDDTLHYDVFATGWRRGKTAWGRPADVIVAPDGALLVSDDMAGVVYRITYAPN